MSDLISRSALLEAMPKNDEIFSFEVRRVICNAPAVDAEVVRCGSCKHREIFFKDPTQMFCHKWLRTMQTDLDFFCAHGEKMDAEVEGDDTA